MGEVYRSGERAHARPWLVVNPMLGGSVPSPILHAVLNGFRYDRPRQPEAPRARRKVQTELAALRKHVRPRWGRWHEPEAGVSSGSSRRR